MHISGEEILYLLNKKGVTIGKEWGGTGNLLVQGDVGIGKGISIPAAKLHIQQTAHNSGIRLDEHGSDRYFRIAYEGQGNIHFYHKNNQGQWMDSGGNWHRNSDLSLKKDITKLNDSLNKVIQLKPVHFRWRNSNNQDIGFIAQDIEEIFPEFVSSVNCNNQKIKGVAYSSFSVLAIAAIQEMKQYYDAQIESLKRQISNLS